MVKLNRFVLGTNTDTGRKLSVPFVLALFHFEKACQMFGQDLKRAPDWDPMKRPKMRQASRI